MGLFSDKSCRIDLAYNVELNYVFNAACRAAQLCGYKIENCDNYNYMIYLSKGMSMLTWAEQVTVARIGEQTDRALQCTGRADILAAEKR